MRRLLSAIIPLAWMLPLSGHAQPATLAELQAANQPVVSDASPVTIVADGRPAATIVVRDYPTKELLFAVQTLREYVRQITGAVLPVVTAAEEVTGNRILLGLSDACREAGRTPPRDLADDGYVICATGNDLAIVGGSDRGTVNGVTGLLDDHLGVRWYVPNDPLGTVVPRMSTITLAGISETREPSFPMRWIGRGSDWAIYNRQSCSGRSLEASFAIEPGIYHTQASLLPHEDYYPEHPEWFALINGRRSTDRGCKLCYSNEDAAAAVAENMARLLDRDPGIDLVSFSPTDGHKWCGCRFCRALDESGVPRDQRMSRRSLVFYNRLAANLRETHPDAHMLVGAYNVYTWPPRDRSMVADPMLSVVITHYDDYCLAHPMADSTCPRNARFRELLRAWDRLGTRVCYYEYYWKVSWFDAPWPIVHSIARDIPWIKRRGDLGLYSQFRTSNAWTLYPNYWIAARLLWDHTADVATLFDEMCRDLYGPAGDAVRQYYRVMEDAMASTDQHFAGAITRHGQYVFTDQVLAQMRRSLREARAATDDPTILARLAKLELSRRYTHRLMTFIALKDSKNPREQRQALAILEELVAEVRTDRATWNGIVSSNVVAEGRFLSRELTRMRQRVGGATHH